MGAPPLPPVCGKMGWHFQNSPTALESIYILVDYRITKRYILYLVLYEHMHFEFYTVPKCIHHIAGRGDRERSGKALRSPRTYQFLRYCWFFLFMEKTRQTRASTSHLMVSDQRHRRQRPHIRGATGALLVFKVEIGTLFKRTHAYRPGNNASRYHSTFV